MKDKVSPNMPKVRVSIAVEKDLADEINRYWRKIVRKALDDNKDDMPKRSNVYEALIAEAWRARKGTSSK